MSLDRIGRFHPCSLDGSRPGSRFLNGKERQVAQSTGRQDGHQIGRQEIRPTRLLAGKSAAGGNGDEYRTILKQADLPAGTDREGPAGRRPRLKRDDCFGHLLTSYLTKTILLVERSSVALARNPYRTARLG